MDNRTLEELEEIMEAELPKSDAVLEGKIRAKQAERSSDDAESWDYGDCAQRQKLIDNGSVWSFEGSAGRLAMSALESGACFLPKRSHKDYYGNIVPCRMTLKPGTKGTLLNSAKFWGIAVPTKGKKK